MNAGARVEVLAAAAAAVVVVLVVAGVAVVAVVAVIADTAAARALMCYRHNSLLPQAVDRGRSRVVQ